MQFSRILNIFRAFFCAVFLEFFGSLGSALADENRQSESALARFWRRFAIFSGNLRGFRAFFVAFARFQPIFADLLNFLAICSDFGRFSGFLHGFLGIFGLLGQSL